MNDILDRLEDASNFAGNVFGGIFQDARKELIAANKRIKILTDGESLMRRNAQEWKDAYIAERDALAKEQEVSDKLLAAFEYTRDAILEGRGPLEDVLDNDKTNAVLAVLDDEFGATLAEVAAIRVGD